MRPPARAVLLVLLALGAAALLPAQSRGQTPPAVAPAVPTLRVLGFSPQRAPWNELVCRQAVAYAIDRETVAQAVAPYLPQRPQPAKGIQHPALPGFNASVQGYSYEPARAKQLFAECGFSGTIRLLVGGGVARSVTAHDDAVVASMRSTLSARVELERVASYEMLLFTAGTGTVPAWIVAWVSDQRNFGYPSFALGIGRALVGDPEVRTLVERGDARRAEELMLRKALVIPIVAH